ncbi:unnamed protein product [Phytomonas sp. EM1]|nr:unnamed protein product [Phytomonas sp. EM1]|eukprot:CCW59848.1 unnamed protein product [Phytomonas sp. isolate EM1]
MHHLQDKLQRVNVLHIPIEVFVEFDEVIVLPHHPRAHGIVELRPFHRNPLVDVVDQLREKRRFIAAHEPEIVDVVLTIKVVDHVKVQLKFGVVVDPMILTLGLLLDGDLFIGEVDESIALKHLNIRGERGQMGLNGSVDQRLEFVHQRQIIGILMKGKKSRVILIHRTGNDLPLRELQTRPAHPALEEFGGVDNPGLNLVKGRGDLLMRRRVVRLRGEKDRHLKERRPLRMARGGIPHQLREGFQRFANHRPQGPPNPMLPMAVVALQGWAFPGVGADELTFHLRQERLRDAVSANAALQLPDAALLDQIQQGLQLRELPAVLEDLLVLRHELRRGDFVHHLDLNALRALPDLTAKISEFGDRPAAAGDKVWNAQARPVDIMKARLQLGLEFGDVFRQNCAFRPLNNP